MREEIVTLLGGRVAESLVLDDISTGASNDLERATKLAKSMVTRYGFSEKLGPVVYGQDDGEPFLGRDFNHIRDYSENVAAEIDNEVREIIDTGYETVKEILTAHMDQLHLVAKYLMDKEKIDGATFEKLMKGELPYPPPSSTDFSVDGGVFCFLKSFFRKDHDAVGVGNLFDGNESLFFPEMGGLGVVPLEGQADRLKSRRF